jgi:ATP synthase protein I
MAGDQPPQPPRRSGANEGWAAVGYLLSGMAVWGGIGWLVDRWLGLGRVPIAVGVVIGAVGGIYLVMRRFSP